MACLDILLDTHNLSDATIEEACNVFKMHGSSLKGEITNKLQEYQSVLSTIKSQEICSSRVQVLANNTVEIL